MKDSYSIEFVFGLNGRSNFASISPSHFESTGELCTIMQSPYRLHYMVDWARLTIEDTFYRVIPNTLALGPKSFEVFCKRPGRKRYASKENYSEIPNANCLFDCLVLRSLLT
jgi:hypothetical protein